MSDNNSFKMIPIDEARDLMDLLMSGETLGLEDLMAFQRNN
mgnify:CR=1 FL=1